MTEDDVPIYVDAGQPATLHISGETTAYPTLQEAIIAWHKLPSRDQEVATIRVDGAIYTASEIERLRHGPR